MHGIMKEPEHELNLLTQELYAKGFTRESPPDWVKPYDWFYGGFQYKTDVIKEMVFSTGCGLHVHGYDWVGGDMSFQGVRWCLENDNPTLNCPYRRVGCQSNHELLRDSKISGGCAVMVFCACHQIEGPYEYQKSIDKVLEDKRKREEELFQKFSKTKGGRVCRQMCIFDERTDEWRFNYDPIDCTHYHCHYCMVLGRELSSKKGNVFYDVCIRRRVEEGVGLLYENKIETTLIKGKQLLDHPYSLDICEIIARTRQAEIYRKEQSRFSRELFFARNHGQYFELEVINVRAERRESRDLLQDLQDVQDGINVIHQSDNKAAAKAQKSKNREAAVQRRKRKYVKLLAENDISSLDGLEQYRISKMMEKGVISQLEIDEAREENLRNQPFEQISLY